MTDHGSICGTSLLPMIMTMILLQIEVHSTPEEGT